MDLEAFVHEWYARWNARDKAGWLEHWRTLAPGEPTIEDPVGTPVKRGWDAVAELWDRTGPNHPTVAVEQLIGGGREVAVVARNEGAYRGEPLRIDSIDVFRVNDDGTSSVRSFWAIPDHIPYGRWTASTGEPAR
jgi:ketosteroid isomerase-like protein